MVETDDDNMTLVEREGTYELVDTKSLSAARLIEDTSSANVDAAVTSEVNDESPSNAVNDESPLKIHIVKGTQEELYRPASFQAEPTKEELYKPFERTTPPPPPARTSVGKKSVIRVDKEEIEKKELAEAAFSHWKKEKDKEGLKKKKEKAKRVEVDKAWNDPVRDSDSPAFKSWLNEKSKQRAAERQVEKLRAQLITAELLTVDYEQTEGAYERWLKQKNKKMRTEKMELNKRSHKDKAHLKQVITSLKTRWSADYHSSHYLHPNAIHTWDNTIYCMDDY